MVGLSSLEKNQQENITQRNLNMILKMRQEHGGI